MKETKTTQEALNAAVQGVQALKLALKNASDYTSRLEFELGNLKSERDALAAKVELLRGAAQQLSFEIACNQSEPNFKSFAALQDVIGAEQQECLRQIKAESGRDGYLLGAEQWCFNQDEMQIDIERSAEEYAEQIRQGDTK